VLAATQTLSFVSMDASCGRSRSDADQPARGQIAISTQADRDTRRSRADARGQGRRIGALQALLDADAAMIRTIRAETVTARRAAMLDDAARELECYRAAASPSSGGRARSSAAAGI